jgi:phenylacetic acid degradation protein paaN
MRLYEKHLDLLNKIIENNKHSKPISHFAGESITKETLEKAYVVGHERFEKYLNCRFEELRQGNPSRWLGEEESPYTQNFLGITYPAFEVDALLKRGKEEYHKWRKVDKFTRAGLLLESITRISKRFSELAVSLMHTTGQNFNIAYFSASLAADHSLCMVGSGVTKITDIIADNYTEHKRKIIIPKGISLIIGDSSAPMLNSLPSIYASLITGNAVIVKPHPKIVIPLAIAISELQKVFSENGFDPNICQLAIDSYEGLISDYLAVNNATRIIDFYGSTEFGKFLEKIPGKTIFCFKRGINSVILDSVDDLDIVIKNLAVSAIYYSGQRFDSYQNVFIPKNGVKTNKGIIPYDDFVARLAEQIHAFSRDRKHALNIGGAVQNVKIFDRIRITERLDGNMRLKSETLENEFFPHARTASPMLMELDTVQDDVYNHKYFGPIIFIIRTESAEHALALAKETAVDYGTNICYAYSTNETFKEKTIDNMALVNVPVCINESAMINYWDDPYNIELMKFFIRSRINHTDFVYKRFNVVDVWE